MFKMVQGAIGVGKMLFFSVFTAGFLRYPNVNALVADKPASCDDISGKWYNQLNSEVEFRHGNGFQLHGTYGSYVNTAQTHGNSSSADATRGRLIGFIKDTALGFTVVWDTSSTMTSYTGNCYVDHERGTVQIRAAWHLVERQDSLADSWKGVRSGQAVFTRQRQQACF
ncbi:avidin-like [Paramacrobiotus metropolitanus]|uniref:avidin-like n=1 Tax=Paramacrobiotus metropolitanus TaxID=2943436 RepID=UPI0024463D3F|nr:avidin-like [Paramacrobiotus metropolitanus]